MPGSDRDGQYIGFQGYQPLQINKGAPSFDYKNYAGVPATDRGYDYSSPLGMDYNQTQIDSEYQNYDQFLSYDPNTPETTQGSRWSSAKNFLFGSTDKETGVRTRSGLLPILNTFTGLASAYLGMKQYGLAKDSFKQNKKEFGYNYDAQRQVTNAQMRGQAAARYSSNPGHYQTPTEYMAQNEIAERTG